MTPFEASLKKNEKLVCSNFRDDREKQKPKINLGQLVRTAVIKRVFSNCDSTNWSYKLHTITEVLHNTLPSYRINYTPERYKENQLRSTNLILEQSNQVIKELSLFQ